MGIRLERKKKRVLIASILYRLIKLPISDRSKFKLFLNAEWMFERLIHEMSFRVYQPEDHPLRKKAFSFMFRNLKPEYTVLDLGCANGEIATRIAENVKFVVGIDKSEELIRKAKKYEVENLVFVCADGVKYLESCDRNFDVLVLSHILEHLDEPVIFLNQFKKFFRFLYIELPDFDRSAASHYREDLNLQLNYTDDDHVSEFDRDEMSDLFLNCGLTVLDSQFIFGMQRYWCAIN